ncbi:hypothetical protein HIM_04074 [Hirsutella minnesotensis 3608]|uniref:Uncharacterized protein n=1 Tax=Hirsutella minnesotensis 3608 TaxID=1043627 RepID=A0A0F7ZVJ8_9HYPO|nr:hypothetical protein HIM_04074 [Hirsutella minnesotensis 3608]
MSNPEDTENWEDLNGETTDLAQAYLELARYQLALTSSRSHRRPPANAHPARDARGERAASALEANLDAFEARLDALLEAAEARRAAARNDAPSVASSSTAVASTQGPEKSTIDEKPTNDEKSCVDEKTRGRTSADDKEPQSSHGEKQA